jgi:hypothetical protein
MAFATTMGATTKVGATTTTAAGTDMTQRAAPLACLQRTKLDAHQAAQRHDARKRNASHGQSSSK